MIFWHEENLDISNKFGFLAQKIELNTNLIKKQLSLMTFIVSAGAGKKKREKKNPYIKLTLINIIQKGSFA